MKHLLLLSCLLAACIFSSCKQEKNDRNNLDQLKKQLDASPNIAKYREAFNQHTMHLAAMSPDELNAIHAKMQQCGLHPGQSTEDELKECLKEVPKNEEYIESEIHLKKFDSLEKVVANEFPELWEMDAKMRATLILSGENLSEDEIKNLLSKRNHQNK